jgi:hypothetical protein
MAKSQSKPSNLSGLVIRDQHVTRALSIAHAFHWTAIGPVRNIDNTGGIHVGPPRKKSKRVSRPSYDFSFSLPLSKEDAELLKRILHEVLGGEFTKFDPNGNEWPDPPRRR